MTENGLLDYVSRRYEYESWARPERRDVNTAVWRFHARNADLGELLPYNEQRVVVERTTVTDSLFFVPESEEEQLLHLQVFECASREAARRKMLELLADFQSPDLRRTDVVGEVAFFFGEATMLLFVRGNVVVLLRHGGPKVYPLDRVAASFEASLTAEEQKFDGELRAEIAEDGSIKIETEPEATYLFSATGGEVQFERDVPTLVREQPDAYVTIVALRDRRAVAGTRLR